jgi:sigma-B regulation protein RsbU (phosphoserine phosphatase)
MGCIIRAMYSTASRLSTLIANLRVGILIEDGKRQVLMANQAFCDLLNLPGSPSNLIGRSSTEWVERAKSLFLDPDRFVRRIEQLTANGSKGTDEILHLTDGRVFKRDHIPIFVEGELSERMWLYRNVTERQWARQQSKVKEYLSAAVEQTADSVMITDRNGRIEYVNPAFEVTTGYRRDEALGQTPRILKSGKHDDEFYRHLWGEVLAGRSFHGTIVNRKKNGELYTAQQTITPMTKDDGQVTHFVAVLRDITEFLRQNEQNVEMRLARNVQQRYYREAVSVPGFDIGGVAYPANETGGDYFDFIPMRDGYLGIAIGDVSGHGLRCALVMAEVRAYIRAFAATSLDVGWILTRVNRALSRDLEHGDFVTMLLVRLDPEGRSLAYANAGHLPPGYLLSRTGEVASALTATGPPLGVLSDYEYVCGDVMPVGGEQLLLLMTDGVTESISPEDPASGELQAVEYVTRHWDESARRIAKGLCHTAQTALSGDQPQQDDITSVILKAEVGAV